MVDYGITRACVAPEEVKLDEYSVWVATNIHTVTVTDEQGEQVEYEFDLTQYTKDEYIARMIDTNKTLEMDIDNTQLALCEVYELLAVVE